MKSDFFNSNPFEKCESQNEAQNFSNNLKHTVPSDGFFVLQKPNCYIQDGMLQADFIAYNISLDDLDINEDVLYKLNVCPSYVLKNFQTVETQMHNIKPLVEQEII